MTSEENAINVTTQQFISAKISGCTLKQGVKHTRHCVRAIYSCKMRLRWRLVKYEQSSIPKNWEYAWSTQENFQVFIIHRSPANFQFSFFTAETISTSWMLPCLKKLFLNSCNSSIMLQKLLVYSLRSALALISLSRQKRQLFRISELPQNTILNMRGGWSICKSGEVVSGHKR